MFICLPPGHPRCRWLCFFSRTQMKIFNLQSVSHVMAVSGTHGFESQKNIGHSAQDSWTVRWIRGKNDINTVQFLAQTDCFMSLDLNVSSQAAGFNLVLSVYVFLSLKAMGPIDCHYMTDRLQRFELKNLICVLLKKQSHLHIGCHGSKQINIQFSFLGELSL